MPPKPAAPRPASRLRGLAAVLALAAAAGCAAATGGGGSSAPSSANAEIYSAWQQHRSPLEVTARGKVVKVLGIRSGPSGRHEGFLVHLTGNEAHDITIRVEDNVDLTGPIPLHSGDDVEIRGEYIFDPRGGIVHYTHRDPRGRHPSGYVRVNGRVYS
jgi:hypothetical protein